MMYDEYDEPEYGDNVVDDMWTDYDYHVNTGELTDWYPDNHVQDEPTPDDFTDWD